MATLRSKWPDLPEAERDRLHKNEVANRSRSRKAELPTFPVPVEGLWIVQRGMCACRECNYSKPLIIGRIVIAHRKHLKSRTTSPGHVAHNVELWNDTCNDREAGQEKHDLHKYDRFEAKSVSISEKRDRKSDKPKKKWGSRPFEKRKNPWNKKR